MKHNSIARGLLLLIIVTLSFSGFSAWINFSPQTIVQPNGNIIECFGTGDEFYNWLHDENGYTIIQSQEDGYYYYASLANDKLVPSAYVVGVTDPATAGLAPWTNIPSGQMAMKRKAFLADQMPPKKELPGYKSTDGVQNTGTLNNLVVYIRFNDQSEYTVDTTQYYNMFNNNNPGYNSMLNYFESVSYGDLSIPSWFYPENSTSTVISYQDTYDRDYFMPYNASSNPSGYQEEQRTSREHGLIKRACQFIADEVPSSLDIDNNNDGYIDNMVFIVKGSTTAWSTLLWPHRWVLYTQDVYINSKKVWDYNFQIENHLNSSGAGVLCHEMFHSLSAPDLYHYGSAPYTSVGPWDVMDNNMNPPQSMGAYMKYRYGGWIESVPQITECGTYTLNPLSAAENNCYKIASPNSTSQYFILEYRVKDGVFEGGIPGSGLLVYRIDNSLNGSGNAQGPPDEVYLYRPGGSNYVNGSLNAAYFSADADRTEINDDTDPDPFLQNGQAGGLSITNIGYAGETITFDVLLEEAPTAEFSGSEVTVTPGCNLDFYDESSCTVDSWTWNFDGGTPATSSDQHPQGISWSTSGSYEVSLTVSNEWGSNTITKSAYIEVSEAALPEVEFFASDSLVCTGQTVVLNDYSKVCPGTWTWEITPETFDFVNGTNANSQQIEIVLNEPGNYSVNLTVSNDNGTDYLLKEDYLEVGGATLPFIEDFETGDPEQRGWEVDNPDEDITWEVYSTAGNVGSKAAGINLFEYFVVFKRDQLISPPINLNDVNEAFLSFQHAYSQSLNTQYSDSLIVKISTDCGNSWTRILELGEDGSYNFATHEPYGYNFTPATADDWCGSAGSAPCNYLDISAWAGHSDVRIMFESVRLTGNNLYVDNVMVTISTGAEEQVQPKSQLLSIFPNPAQDQVNILLEEDHQFSALTMYNSLGQIIEVQDLYPDQTSVVLNLAGLPRGLYFISAGNSKGRIISKLVLK